MIKNISGHVSYIYPKQVSHKGNPYLTVLMWSKAHKCFFKVQAFDSAIYKLEQLDHDSYITVRIGKWYESEVFHQECIVFMVFTSEQFSYTQQKPLMSFFGDSFKKFDIWELGRAVRKLRKTATSKRKIAEMYGIDLEMVNYLCLIDENSHLVPKPLALLEKDE